MARRFVLALVFALAANAAAALERPTPPVGPVDIAECNEFGDKFRAYKSALLDNTHFCFNSMKSEPTSSPVWRPVRIKCNGNLSVAAGCAAEDEAYYCAEKEYYDAMQACRAAVRAFDMGRPPPEETALQSLGSTTAPSATIDKRDIVAEPVQRDNPVVKSEYFFLWQAFENTRPKPPKTMDEVRALEERIAKNASIEAEQKKFERDAAVARQPRATIDDSLAFLRRMAAEERAKTTRAKGIPNAASEAKPVSSGGSSGGGGGGGGGQSNACSNPYGGSSAPSGAFICSNQGELLACQCGGGGCRLSHTGAFQCTRAGAVIH